MSWVPILIAVVSGFALGIGIAFLLFRENAAKRKAHIDTVIENLKASFGSLSLDVLSKSTEEFLKLAKEKLESERAMSAKELEEKKGLIDQQLQHMTSELENVSKLMKDLEKDRVEKFGELASQLKTASEQTATLTQTTNTLREALASSKVRGQWGERMAEDVLRLVGFIENVNYLKQKAIEGSGSRPDFTFLLPRDLKLNMDVKFPLNNYLKYLEADSEIEKTKFRNDFLRDVKSRIKEVTTREYINPEQNTVDYVLLFIPNEQIYAFIHEQDSTILDNALKNRVVFCSPLTLYAILAVIRQAVDNFALERSSQKILMLLGTFKKQWGEFLKKLEQLGQRIGAAQKEYESLTTTRRRQLEKPLNEIENLRKQRNLPIASEEDISPALEEPEKESEENLF